MQAIRSTRPGGHVGYVGVSHDVELPGEELFFSHVHLHGGPAPVRRFLPDLIDLIWNGKINPARSSTSTLPLDEAAAGHTAPWTTARPSRCCCAHEPHSTTSPARSPWSPAPAPAWAWPPPGPSPRPAPPSCSPTSTTTPCRPPPTDLSACRAPGARQSPATSPTRHRSPRWSTATVADVRAARHGVQQRRHPDPARRRRRRTRRALRPGQRHQPARRLGLHEARTAPDAQPGQRRDRQLLLARRAGRRPRPGRLPRLQARRHRADQQRRPGIRTARRPHQRHLPRHDRHPDGRPT